MKWTFRNKLLWSAAIGCGLLAAVSGSRANSITELPGVNLLDNPGFASQSPNFQSTLGPYAAGWTYTAGFVLPFSSDCLDLVSQTIPTSDLYYYDISFGLGTQPSEPGLEFGLFWNYSSVDLRSLTPSDSFAQYTYTVTAAGPVSDFALVGNAAFWSSLSGLEVYWTGDIDPPPIPDSPIGLGFQATLLAGLCGAAGIHRRQHLCMASSKLD